MKKNSSENTGRPLSPHISIYKWRYVFFAPSIFHRLTGIFMAVSFAGFCYLLISLASGEEQWKKAISALSHPIGRMYLTALVWSFSLHLSNGIRHFFWDAGYGFEKQTATMTGYFVWISSVVLTVVFCLVSGLW